MKDHQPDFHQLHFDSIQALRGITALFIVLEHIRFLNCGAFGVDIFFCISGFMIMFSTHKGPAYFLRKRLIRILPLYYLMTAGTFLLLILFPGMFEQTKADPVFLVKSLLFIPFDIGNGALQPLMRIGWTVNCEIFFYLVFFAAMHISHRFRGLICGLFLAGITAAAALLPSPPAFLAFYGNPVMLEFLFGITAYYAAWGLYRMRVQGSLPVFRKAVPEIEIKTAPPKGRIPGSLPNDGGPGPLSKDGTSEPLPKDWTFELLPISRASRPLKNAGAVCSLALVLLCFVWLIATKPTINILGFRRLFVWGIPAFLIVMGSFLLGLHGGKIPPSLVRLGDISFSLYLMHYYPVALLDRAVFDFSAFTPYGLFGVAAAVAISVTLAMISWALIEKRFCGWLRSHLLNRNHP